MVSLPGPERNTKESPIMRNSWHDDPSAAVAQNVSPPTALRSTYHLALDGTAFEAVPATVPSSLRSIVSPHAFGWSSRSHRPTKAAGCDVVDDCFPPQAATMHRSRAASDPW